MKLTAIGAIQCSGDELREIRLTLEAFNSCCNWISERAWVAKVFRRFDLHHLVYYDARAAYPMLYSSAICHAIASVSASYKRSAMRVHVFRDLSSMPLKPSDQHKIKATSARLRLLRWQEFSVAFAPRHIPLLAHKHKEARVGLRRDGSAYLALVVEIPDVEPIITADAIGVDLGVVNIATDSDGNRHSGATLKGVRYRRRRLRAKLDQKGTRSAKRVLKRLRRREARFARDVNHVISKRLVAEAERTKRAIAIEELRGICSRVRVSGKQQRAVLSSWSFGQLRSFITYKAELAGVPLVLVNPRNSSRECSACGHVDKRNRTDQATFRCRVCGFAAHADYNAAMVIRDRGRAALSRPYATSASHSVASPLFG